MYVAPEPIVVEEPILVESEPTYQDISDAIEGIETMIEFAEDAEKQAYIDAVDGMKTMLEFMDKPTMAKGGDILTELKDGAEVVLKAETSGGKWGFEVVKQPDGLYDIIEYKGGSSRGGSHNIGRIEDLKKRVLDNIIGSAKIDGINYKLSIDKLGIEALLVEAKKRWDIENSKGYFEWRKSASPEFAEEIKAKAIAKGLEVANEQGLTRQSDIDSAKMRVWKDLVLEAYIKANPEVEMEQGGEIKNQYVGNSYDKIWNKWDNSQRLHFILDHVKQSTPSTQEELTKKSYRFLPQAVKIEIARHIESGQYKDGGNLYPIEDARKPNIGSGVVVLVKKTKDEADKFVSDKPDLYVEEDADGDFLIKKHAKGGKVCSLKKGGSLPKGEVDITEDLKNFDLNNLDLFEDRQYVHNIQYIPKEEALQVIINTVEGDFTQLSAKLSKLAKKQNREY